ncbi:hypothetical protein ACJJIF_10430 [Microbulbifer sp. SSSA002]|uniref:hypothetical protein n=1 Tax=unclassified Microbulbifer TaxID=2619833 RepID=UPI00403A4B36
MKKLLLATLVLTSANLGAETISIQAIPTIKSVKGDSVSFSFSTTSEISEDCKKKLDDGISASFQASYKIFNNAANNGTNLNIDLYTFIDENGDENCGISTITP